MFKQSVELKRVHCPKNIGISPFPVSESEIWDALVYYLPSHVKYLHHILEETWEPNGELIEYKSVFPNTTSGIGKIKDGNYIYILHIYYE